MTSTTDRTPDRTHAGFPGQTAACAGAPIIGPLEVQRVAELGWAMWASAAVQAGAQLRLADAVGEEPVSVAELAATVGADETALARLMRALGAFGIFVQVGPGRYGHTEASRALRSGAAEGLADIMLTGSHWGWATWGELADSVRSGECAFTARHGKNLFTYFHEDDNRAGELCLRGYAAQSRAMNPGVVAALDMAGASTFCDVGGGHGSLVASLLEAHPEVHGILYDRPHAIDALLPQLRTGPLAQRCTALVGDCAEEVPPAQLYLIRQVLHMWEDEDCERVLRNCAAAGGPGARVVLLEQLLEDPPETPWDALMDLHMLLVMGGRERSAEQYADMFARAGLRPVGVTPTGTPLRLLEAVVPE